MRDQKIKHLIRVIAPTIIVASFICLYFGYTLISTKSQVDTKDTVLSPKNLHATDTPSNKVESSTDLCKYIVKETDGIIGVFSPNDIKSPLFTIKTNVKSLPIKDQIMLFEGISISSESDLQRLVEDYSS